MLSHDSDLKSFIIRAWSTAAASNSGFKFHSLIPQYLVSFFSRQVTIPKMQVLLHGCDNKEYAQCKTKSLVVVVVVCKALKHPCCVFWYQQW